MATTAYFQPQTLIIQKFNENCIEIEPHSEGAQKCLILVSKVMVFDLIKETHGGVTAFPIFWLKK